VTHFYPFNSVSAFLHDNAIAIFKIITNFIITVEICCQISVTESRDWLKQFYVHFIGGNVEALLFAIKALLFAIKRNCAL